MFPSAICCFTCSICKRRFSMSYLPLTTLSSVPALPFNKSSLRCKSLSSLLRVSSFAFKFNNFRRESRWPITCPLATLEPTSIESFSIFPCTPMVIVASLLSSRLAGKTTLPSYSLNSAAVVATAIGIFERSTTTLFASIFFLFLASVNVMKPISAKSDMVRMSDFFIDIFY